MRTFIAIDISEDIRSSLAQVISHLKYSGADVKWVKPDNIHLTLKFLGEIDEEKLRQVKAALDEIGKLTKPFELSIKDIGAFPKIDYPRVIWVGLDKGADGSIALAKAVDEELSKLGFAKEPRPFSPHLTIGRVRSPKNKDVLKEKILAYSVPRLRSGQALSLPKGVERRAYSCRISSIILFQSILTPQGSIYTKLHEAKFLQ